MMPDEIYKKDNLIKEIDLLSTRNQKRFNKLLPKIEQRFTELKNENEELKQKTEFLTAEVDAR